jgi:hypothetical protein
MTNPAPEPQPLRLAHFSTQVNGDWQREAMACMVPCNLVAANCANKGVAGLWFWICDSQTVGAIKPTCAPVYVPPNACLSLDWRWAARSFAQGIYVCVSTDPVTKTLPATNDAFFEVAYTTQ